MPTLTTAGAVPTSPTDLLNQEIAAASALAPGLTANLPGSLVEDMASTAAGAVVIQDQTFVDLVNSISPYTANSFILYQLGAVYGVQQGVGSNTSVYVIFTGLVGYVIPIGFTVSDGTYQYTIQDGGIIGSSGQSPSLYCLATTAGSWSVPAGTVTHLITSVPSGYTLTVTYPTAGLAGATAQTTQSYQAQVIQAGLSTAQGMPAFVKTQLQRVSGVQPNLVAVRNLGSNQWQIICGGGDPYQVAGAIFNSVPDISILVGSSTTSRNEVVTIYDYPDSYSITYVIPPSQLVVITLVWNTNSLNYVSPTAVAQLGQPALAAYINGIYVGQPINVFEMQSVFQTAIQGIIPPQTLSRMVFTVAINGSVVTPTTGTGLIVGDPESYFSTSSPNITITKG